MKYGLLILIFLGNAGCLSPLTDRLDNVNGQLTQVNAQLQQVNAQLVETNKQLERANQQLEKVEVGVRRMGGAPTP
ncbi:MAG: hypothetical protein U0796_03935 [Gemmatales bacterium]